jgi:hypothetical protein
MFYWRSQVVLCYPNTTIEKLRTFPTHHLRRQGFVLWQVPLPALSVRPAWRMVQV